MANNTCLKLSNLLEMPLDEVNRLEKRIQKILRDKNAGDNDDDENDDAIIIENKMKELIDHQYDSLKLIDRTKRIAFWNELNTQLQRLPRRCLTEEVESQMKSLQMLCHFDFTQKPLSFAFEGIHDMDLLTGFEGQLLGLIDKLRNGYGLRNVLDTEYESIRNQRRKVVLAVAGGLKAGKSSFINYLLESDVCPVGICETTARLTKITYGPQKLVKLESITGELKEQYEIHSNEQLKEVTKKLIALEGKDREEDLCKDIVTIQLDRKELENIELWDIPGFDENSFLNSIIQNILKETNIFFILTSITEAVRETMVNLLRSCSENHEYQPQVCFIVTKIDQVTTNPNAKTTLDKELDHVFKRIQDRYQMKLDDDWKSSPFFIPLCTDRKYSLKDFLDSYEQFTHKLSQFFTHAVRFNTICRLKYLIDTMHELLDYDDLDRSIQRDEKVANMLAVHIAELRTQLDKELKQTFLQIHKDVAYRISAAIEPGNDNDVRQMLIDEIENELLQNHETIEQGVSKCLTELYSKLEKNPALTAVIHSLGEHRLYSDPYQAVVGQHRNVESSLISSAKFYYAAPSLGDISVCFVGAKSIKNWLSTSDTFRNNKYLALAVLVGLGTLNFISNRLLWMNYNDTIIWNSIECGRQIRNRLNLVKRARENAESSVDTILQGLMEDITNNVHQTLCEQLNAISEDVRRRKAKLSEQKNTTEAQLIAQFLKKNTLSIVQLYLNLLDKTNRFEYPRCKIDTTNVLGKSNFPVFAGELADANRTYVENIAAKRVPLNNFTWQEVRYMNELKHENILRYYGVRKSEDVEDHYDILMQRLDSDLTKYIDYASRKGKVNDKLIDNIFIQITNGLAYLHEQGIIHRDIKPENVLVQLKKNQPPVFIIADFGFVHRVPTSIKGTPGFLAPELTNNPDSTFYNSKSRHVCSWCYDSANFKQLFSG